MSGICEGRVAIVTGAGRGLGRAHALELGREGASVVVNDLGVELDGSGGGPDWANEVATEIRALGGQAVVDNSDISDWAGAQAVVERAISEFGGLDVLVNNAGVLRDRMIISLTADDVTKVISVHLCGALFTSHHAGRYWRERAKAGETPAGRASSTPPPEPACTATSGNRPTARPRPASWASPWSARLSSHATASPSTRCRPAPGPG